MHSNSSSSKRTITNRKFCIIVTIVEILMLLYTGCELRRVWKVDCVNFENEDDSIMSRMSDWIQPLLRIRSNEHFDESYTNCVRHVFHQFDYKLEINETVFENDGTTTDYVFKNSVPWTVDHPESPDKVIDQIPGLNDYVTYKASLVSRGGRYMPKAFSLPQQMKDFLRYIRQKENKDKVWIQKHPRYRENVVRKPKDMDFNNISLVQEFVSNPFLVTGRKFSIGSFVAFSSARPLRAYVLRDYFTHRFCEDLYDADDLSDPASYVTDGMERGGGVNVLEKEGGEADELKKLYKKNYSLYKALDHVAIMRGKDPSDIKPQICDAIRDALNSSLPHMLTHNVTANAKYFQYTRWDFLLDDNMNIHLIEANINPALDVEDDNPAYLNRFYYRVLALIIRAMRMDTHDEYQNERPSYHMRNSDVNIFKDICYTPSCSDCQEKMCQICSHCLSKRHVTILREVLTENVRRDDVKLMYPVAQEETMAGGSTYYDHLSDENKLTVDWIRHKCQRDDFWCTV